MTGKITLSSVSLIFACGTALFSDGYGNNVIGFVLKRIYGTGSDGITANYSTTLSSVAFAGAHRGGYVTFGYLSDKAGRKFGMMSATGIVAVFSGLSLDGMLAMLIACRFLLGIGIGAEYPCGSVSASEQSEEEGIAKNRNTNGLFGDNHLRAIWRLSLGLGVVPATGVFFWRLRMEEPNRYKRDSMKHVRIPYRLVIKRYWRGLLGISLAWFIYDFITYFVLYSSTITDTVTGGNSSLTVVFGWSVVINLFYIPGTVIGAFFVDLMGPKATMITGLLAQAVIGFIMSGLYTSCHNTLPLLLWCPGNCVGVVAAKSGPTAVRGQYYGVAAATGKIGAFIGTWVFPVMINDFGGSGSAKGNTGPFFVASGLAILSAIIVYFLVTPLDHDGMKEEDAKFREYLEAHGFDTSRMGLPKTETVSYAEGKEAGLAVKDTDSATKV
ncbi:major facilitator superfamily domain-containing protein [Suillus tomentosus]|nr:major facilitator superfamily domain-containing protein [Suillus tomentosus]